MYNLIVIPTRLGVFRVPNTNIFVDPLLVSVMMHRGKVVYYINTPIEADLEPLNHTSIDGRTLKYHGCTLIRRPRNSTTTKLVYCDSKDYDLLNCNILYEKDGKVIALVEQYKYISKNSEPCRCREDCVCY
jgi:hypothetical protein